MDEIDFNGLVFSTTENESSGDNEDNGMGATFWEAQLMEFPTAIEL
jgi:hypothetical protein